MTDKIRQAAERSAARRGLPVATVLSELTGQHVTGLGDIIAAGTRAIGITPCGGCKKRQAALNNLVPFT